MTPTVINRESGTSTYPVWCGFHTASGTRLRTIGRKVWAIRLVSRLLASQAVGERTMSVKNTLATLALAGSLTLLGSACVVRAHGQAGAPVTYVEVNEEPPPPRVVVVDTRPGYVWIQGRWTRGGNRWVWSDGYWERERAGHVWEQGRWERRGRGHVWVSGRWRSGANNPGRGGPAVRDHRRGNNGRGNGQGPAVRDHRR